MRHSAPLRAHSHLPFPFRLWCVAIIFALTRSLAAQDAPERLDRGRFTFLFYPRDRQLATSLATRALATDTFPGLPRLRQHVTIAIAPDQRRFREWAGGAPEWGSAIAFPDSRRIVLQGQRAGSDAGDPVSVLRHEIAHLALHEYLGNLPPRWFDEGYASYSAGEWGREELLMTNVALALRGMPSLDELEASFSGGATTAQTAYALSYRAVAVLAQMDKTHGLSLFLTYWRDTKSLERAMRQAYGTTLAGFERHWQVTTRQQYGALALVSNVTLAGLLLLFLLTPLYVARRRRDRNRLQRMKEADAAADRAAANAIDDLLGESSTNGQAP
ncbi:MAG TPA: hypothetical protein VFT29_11045 [Gemmatimonadaceae bacterium]|nr:hypothetical protein [Gemmatimonadaceae bacterium]